MDNEPRDIQDVIISILEIIPEKETNLLNELKKFNTKMYYQPPEHRKSGECWIPFAHILNRNIPDITEDWQIKIQKIVNKE